MVSKAIGNTVGLGKAEPIEVNIKKNENIAIVFDPALHGPPWHHDLVLALSALGERFPAQEVQHTPSSIVTTPKALTRTMVSRVVRRFCKSARGPTAGA